MKNTNVTLGDGEHVETNASLRETGEDYDRETNEEDGGCRPRGVDARNPAYDTRHDYEYQGSAGDTSFYKCRKCGDQFEA